MLQEYAMGAAYDSNSRYPAANCLEGTRRDVTDKIIKWMKIETSPRIFWLQGVMGVGKSSVAQSLAERCADNKTLGASFFFSKDDVDRNTHKALFTTIAWQLCENWPSAKFWIRNALKIDRTIPYKS